jgi:hypothetical protein
MMKYEYIRLVNQEMIMRNLLGLSFLFAAPILAEAELPKEAPKLIERRELCEHFRQEPWPEGPSVEESERRDFIVNQIKQFCPDSDSDKAAQTLSRKYRNEQTVIDTFGDVEWKQ